MKGVEVHRGAIRIYFNYKGKQRKEPLRLADTPKNRKYARELVSEIENEIAIDIFNYAKHFPNSRQLPENLLNHWLDLWLELKKFNKAPSTYSGYKRWVNVHIRPKWGDFFVGDLNAILIERWIAQELVELASKSIREIVSIIGQVYTIYRKNTNSTLSPTDGIKIELPDDEDPDAFDFDEIRAISSTKAIGRESELNMAIFSLWSGPRPSEAMALCWNDVDLEKGEATFKQSVVTGVYKATKTKRSHRSIDLLLPALEALRRQKLITGDLPSRKIRVLQRDNRTYREIEFKPVFVNTRSMSPYKRSKDFSRAFWDSHLISAKVRHRGYSTCRHTFASMMITKQMNVQWICDQLGHTTDAMLYRKYGKLFKKYRDRNPADEANEKFGFATSDERSVESVRLDEVEWFARACSH